MSANRVLFFQVRTADEKLRKIPEIAKESFEKNQKLLILTKDKKTLQFIDELLWKLPKASFLPHKVSRKPCSDLIVLTDQMQNLNEANSIFNLTGQPLLSPIDHVTKIYELEDLTTPEKKILSEKRFKSYRDAGFAITSL